MNLLSDAMLKLVTLVGVCMVGTSFGASIDDARSAMEENEPPSERRFRECDQCPEMVVMPPGQYFFGSPPDEPGRDNDEGPQVHVRLTPFAVSRFEITRSEFSDFVTASGHKPITSCYIASENGRWDPRADANWRAAGFAQDENHPVVCVSWTDANAYVHWLNSMVPGEPYRLLSESEWEYVARAGSATPFWWGTEQAEFCSFANGGDADARDIFPDWTRAGDCSDGYAYTAPVGAYPENAYGVSDLVGNVWEWTADCYQASLSDQSADGKPIDVESCEKRVVRGGAWDFSALYLRTAYRGAWFPEQGFANFGFRVARDL